MREKGVTLRAYRLRCAYEGKSFIVACVAVMYTGTRRSSVTSSGHPRGSTDISDLAEGESGTGFNLDADITASPAHSAYRDPLDDSLADSVPSDRSTDPRRAKRPSYGATVPVDSTRHPMAMDTGTPPRHVGPSGVMQDVMETPTKTVYKWMTHGGALTLATSTIVLLIALW